MSFHRRPSAAAAVLTMAAALLVPLAQPAAAQVVAQATIVSADPAGFTPNVLDGKINAFAQVGTMIVAAGSFTQVQASGGGATLTRQNIVAFNATTGVISTTFVPTVSGEVYDLEPAADSMSVYVVGSFTTVNGSASSRLARLSVADGQKVVGFTAPSINGTVKNVDLVSGRLLLGGSFSSVGGQTRTALASVDPASGALTSFLNLSFGAPINGGGTQVLKMAATPNGNRLAVIGNFTQVAGAFRQQIAMINISGSTAALADWATDFYTNSCNPVFDTYMRDLDFSPDSSYFVVSVTGAYGGPDSPCDVITRWETYATGTDLSATWRDYTGGDTSYAVAVTGTAVYVGGHMRWMNNPYAGDAVGPGAVPREGIAALDPVSGLPLSWNPGRARGVGVFDMLATSTGLWVGSDTDRIGNETHRKIAFFPLAGGVTPPAQLLGTVPNDVYLLGRVGAGADPGVLFRVNAGGPALQSADDGPDWMSDAAADAANLKSGPSNAADWGSASALHSSVPQTANDRAPAALFATESWGPDAGNEMGWHFPVTAGTPVTVRLYLGNKYDGTSQAGQRVFDISVDGGNQFPGFDIIPAFGDQVGGMRSVNVTSDGMVDIDFTHVTENPLINGIEIIRQGSQGGGGGGFTAADDVQRRFLSGATPGPNTVLTPSASWSLDRGSFLIDSTLYTGWADGTFTRRTFNGSTFSAPTVVPMFDGSFGAEVSNLTGIVYSQGRIYYTLFGDDRLFWRWFSPESRVVGATEFEVGGDVAALDPSQVQGMFLSGSSLYFADRGTGDLSRVTLSATPVTEPAVTGSASIVDTTLDWRARGMFLWNGAPAGSTPNVPPTAAFTSSCSGLACTFPTTGSSDSDGTIASYAWTFGADGSGTGTPGTHTFSGAGTYSVTLVVTDDDGATGTVSHSVTVPPVASSITFRAGASSSVGSANATVPVPSGMQSGDTLLLFVTGNKGAAPATAPAGWTFVRDQVDGTDLRTLLYRRTAPATGPLGTVGWGVATKSTITVLAYSGAAAVQADALSSAKTTGASTSYTAPALTVAGAGAVVVSYFSLRGATAPTWTAPAGTTVRSSGAGTGSGLVAGFAVEQGPVGAGTAIPIRTATATVSSAKATGWTVVLNPA